VYIVGNMAVVDAVDNVDSNNDSTLSPAASSRGFIADNHAPTNGRISSPFQITS
jgi:hypothetical protein